MLLVWFWVLVVWQPVFGLLSGFLVWVCVYDVCGCFGWFELVVALRRVVWVVCWCGWLILVVGYDCFGYCVC